MKGVACCTSGLVTIITSRPSLLAQDRPHEGLQVTVENALGGILVGAKITLQEVKTQQTREQAGDDKGHANVDGLSKTRRLIL